ncbi:MAG: DUF3883 domain-containing protein [Mesorhizobium sp.]|nr:MAG: DUF3883 domain-containing protein [Mesorhizobium sp.]
MYELPSRGRCHAAFLLAYSARLRPSGDFNSWVISASGKSTIMAASTDVLGTARLLVDINLASITDVVAINPVLAAFDSKADRHSLLGIARLLLQRCPPAWIGAAIVDGRLAPEFIPDSDLETLSWLGPDLEPLLVEIHHRLTRAAFDERRKMLGNAGELAIMSALRYDRYSPVHVALLSDWYGYDIENRRASATERLEVKACVRATADRVFVSRNEFDKAAKFGSEWRLIQVIFSSSVMVERTVVAAHVEEVRELSSGALQALAPDPSPTFQWTDSAEFRPTPDMWIPSALRVDNTFSLECR